jgi:hypothetical protein
MNVASLENCKKLYELSGWETGEWFTFGAEDAISLDEFPDIPKYDLGYLLRKLPKEIYAGRFLHLTYPIDLWVAGYTTDVDGVVVGKVSFDNMQTADTPEDAVCLLAIKLFEQGQLNKEGARNG